MENTETVHRHNMIRCNLQSWLSSCLTPDPTVHLKVMKQTYSSRLSYALSMQIVASLKSTNGINVNFIFIYLFIYSYYYYYYFLINYYYYYTDARKSQICYNQRPFNKLCCLSLKVNNKLFILYFTMKTNVYQNLIKLVFSFI